MYIKPEVDVLHSDLKFFLSEKVIVAQILMWSEKKFGFPFIIMDDEPITNLPL